MTDEFIEEFGETFFLEVFENIYGDVNSPNIHIADRTFKDQINSYGYGFIQLGEREIMFTFRDGDYDGSQIEEYSGSEINIPTKTTTIPVFILDEDRIINEGKQGSLELMRNKYIALADRIEEKQRAYSYDSYHQPGSVIEEHYRAWLHENYLKITYLVVEID